MVHWDTFNPENSIKDFEFTKRAVSGIRQVAARENFEEYDGMEIFEYLKNEIALVCFGDYLKRFLYEQTGMEVGFDEISEGDYIYLIQESFERNHAPFSRQKIEENERRKIRKWLKADTVARNTIFILGFGLSMTEKEVNLFLTKVLMEEGIRMTSPWEVISWYCFHNQMPYRQAAELWKYYNEGKRFISYKTNWSHVSDILPLHLTSKESLKEYLMYLKYDYKDQNVDDLGYETFACLYQRCKVVIADLYNEQESFTDGSKDWEPGRVKDSDVEHVLCSGIPYNQTGNLERATRSTLNKHISTKRMSRQRISNLLKKKFPVERFDLITLLFLIHSQQEPDNPEQRLLDFIDETNEILKGCEMMELYPVNAYEAFIMMCLLSIDPLCTYSEVWELSYEKEDGMLW